MLCGCENLAYAHSHNSIKKTSFVSSENLICTKDLSTASVILSVISYNLFRRESDSKLLVLYYCFCTFIHAN